MSFFSDLFSSFFNKPDPAKPTFNSLLPSIVQTIGSGLMLRKLYQSDQKQSNSPTPANSDPDGKPIVPINLDEPDQGVRLQATADPANRIPIVYGEAYTQGKLVDVEMGNDNKTMYYTMVFSEKTGNKIDGTASAFKFLDVYVDNMRCVFKADGVTVDYIQDRNSFQDNSLSGLMEFYCYAGNSTSHVQVGGFLLGSGTTPAYSVMPSWTSTDAMNDLIFLVAKLTYAPGKNQTRLPSITVHLKNSMDQPGDVLYDYMTNSRYGAGILETEIYVS
jgi:hypothetical protein